MKAVKTVSVEVFTDDRTGDEIVTGGGWELRTIDEEKGRTYHFRSLSSLAVALTDEAQKVFGLSQLGDFIRLERGR